MSYCSLHITLFGVATSKLLWAIASLFEKSKCRHVHISKVGLGCNSARAVKERERDTEEKNSPNCTLLLWLFYIKHQKPHSVGCIYKHEQNNLSVNCTILTVHFSFSTNKVYVRTDLSSIYIESHAACVSWIRAKASIHKMFDCAICFMEEHISLLREHWLKTRRVYNSSYDFCIIWCKNWHCYTCYR